VTEYREHEETNCPHCGRAPTGTRTGRHIAVCEREHAAFYLSPTDWMAIERAGAHTVHANLLEPAQRFQDGVSDLDAARLLRALDAHAQVAQVGRDGWMSRPSIRWTKGLLGRTVRECLRLKLVEAHTAPGVGAWITPAEVHLAGVDNLRPLCDDSDPWEIKSQRYRLVRERLLADCVACLLLPSNV
jgi:hypothetical protein